MAQTPRPKAETPPPPAGAHVPAAHEPKPTPTLLRVRALKMGYYDNKRRREGDVFTIDGPQAFSAKWMEYVDADTPERLTTGQDELERLRQEHLGAQRRSAPSGPAPSEPATGNRNVLGD